MQDDPVLRHFSLSQDDLLGFGGESRVYALDDERVLRVYEREADRGYVDRLREFYANLGSRDLPFEIPVVIELATHGDLLYAIEKRIQGSRMSDFLKKAAGEARTRSLVSYVEMSNRVQELPSEGNEFGELILPDSMRRPTWTEYLLARARDSFSRADAEFARDVPDLNDIVAGWERDLALVSDVRAPRLVHGDYFPGNVMVNERGQVIAVIDFSPMSLAGDPRLDVLCALIFIEVDDGYQSSDSETVRQLIAERHGDAVLELEHVYRTYYSLYFSPVRKSDPKLYAWCVANLSS